MLLWLGGVRRAAVRCAVYMQTPRVAVCARARGTAALRSTAAASAKRNARRTAQHRPGPRPGGEGWAVGTTLPSALSTWQRGSCTRHRARKEKKRETTHYAQAPAQSTTPATVSRPSPNRRQTHPQTEGKAPNCPHPPSPHPRCTRAVLTSCRTAGELRALSFLRSESNSSLLIIGRPCSPRKNPEQITYPSAKS